MSVLSPQRVVEWKCKITNQCTTVGAYMATIHVQGNTWGVSTFNIDAVQSVRVVISLNQELLKSGDRWSGFFTWQRAFTVVRPGKLLPRRKRHPTPEGRFRVAYNICPFMPRLTSAPYCVSACVLTELPLAVQASVRQLRSYDVTGVEEE